MRILNIFTKSIWQKHAYISPLAATRRQASSRQCTENRVLYRERSSGQRTERKIVKQNKENS